MRLLDFLSLAGVLVAARLSACGQQLPKPGWYVETPPAGTILWVGRAVLLRSDSTFSYRQWSDDLSAGRYGAGTYQVAGRQLRLLFAAPAPRASRASRQPLPTRPDSLTLVFRVEAADTVRGVEAVPFATVTAYGTNGNGLATSTADEFGRATVRLAGTRQPLLLRVASLGMQTWQQSVPAASTAYRVQLLPNLGEPYPAGTVKVLQMQPQRRGQLALRDEGSQYPLLLQPAK